MRFKNMLMKGFDSPKRAVYTGVIGRAFKAPRALNWLSIPMLFGDGDPKI